MFQADDIENERQSGANHPQNHEQWPTRCAQHCHGLIGIAQPEEYGGEYRKRYHENRLWAAVWCRILEAKNEYRIGQAGKQSGTESDRCSVLLGYFFIELYVPGEV